MGRPRRRVTARLGNEGRIGGLARVARLDRDGRSTATSVVKEALAWEWWQQEQQRLRREVRWQERRRCAWRRCAWRLWERRRREGLLHERQRVERRRPERRRRERRQQERWWRARQWLERRRRERRQRRWSGRWRGSSCGAGRAAGW